MLDILQVNKEQAPSIAPSTISKFHEKWVADEWEVPHSRGQKFDWSSQTQLPYHTPHYVGSQRLGKLHYSPINVGGKSTWKQLAWATLDF